MRTTTTIDRIGEALGCHENPTRVWLVGAPWFATPSAILDGLSTACTATSFPYPPAQGVRKLREAICALQTHRAVALSPDQVVVTHGAKGGIFGVLACLLGAGDELLLPTPCYPAYATIARTLGITPVPIAQDGGQFSLTAATLDRHLTSRTRAVILSSPCNPTGAVLRGDQARLLVDFCRRHELRLVCDEAYEAFCRTDENAPEPTDLDPSLETVVLIRSFSKVFAVCGWRIGYVAADTALARRVAGWQSAHLNPPNQVGQHALAAAPDVPQKTLTDNRYRVQSRLAALATVLTDVGLAAHPPDGGFYLWVDVRPLLASLGLTSSLDLCLELARKQGIGLWPGEDFLCPGFVRISAAACPEDGWSDAVARLGDGVLAVTRGFA